MWAMETADVVIIGGGIVGLATARAIHRSRPSLRTLVLEKEEYPGTHQSGRNSGVIHSGVYYQPGSLKARTVATGRLALLSFCRENGIAYETIGKVIVAVDESERPGLQELKRRADGNNVPATVISPARLADLEPHAAGIEALHVPGAGIIDFRLVCETLVRLLEATGVEVRTRTEVGGLEQDDRAVILATGSGHIEARVVINCAGLHSDRVARLCDDGEAVRIVPFRGEYRGLVHARAHLVRTMIYPVPDPQFPFLGVHFTRAIGGGIHAGPNAVLALAREGYSWRNVDFADTWGLIRFPGFRRLAARHWRTGLAEMRRSLSPAAFLGALQRLVPEIQESDLVAAPSGVRAQAVDVGGDLMNDFVVHESARVVHVLNAPSPAATASLEIGRLVAERATMGRL